MANSVRRSILETAKGALSARAGDWSAQLQGRLSTLTSDLENANRHRAAIVARLAALVEGALRTLRQASRLSELPSDLVEWSGRKFLRIAFADTDSATITIHVADVVDRIAASYATRSTGARGSSPRRDGVALLLEAVHASVPRGFAVDVLKPDTVLHDERVPIEEVSDVFSGGQELTAAIVLYCTLAALRANERGQMRAKHCRGAVPGQPDRACVRLVPAGPAAVRRPRPGGAAHLHDRADRRRGPGLVPAVDPAAQRRRPARWAQAHPGGRCGATGPARTGRRRQRHRARHGHRRPRLPAARRPCRSLMGDVQPGPAPLSPRASRLAVELDQWPRRTLSLGELWAVWDRSDPASAGRPERRTLVAAALAELEAAGVLACSSTQDRTVAPWLPTRLTLQGGQASASAVAMARATAWRPELAWVVSARLSVSQVQLAGPHQRVAARPWPRQ